MIEGVGKDAPMVVNEAGGKQSKVDYAFDALDPLAMFAMCKVLEEGRQKYGSDENWRKIPWWEHWNHLVIHAFALKAGDKSDNHPANLLCRAMMLYATYTEAMADKHTDGLQEFSNLIQSSLDWLKRHY